MGWENMEVAQINTGYQRQVAFEKEINLTGVSVSNWIIIPDQIQKIDVTISFSGGATGKIQTSTDKVNVVKTGSPVLIDWPFGTVSENIARACKPVTAMRGVQETSGDMKLTMRTQ